MDAHGVNPRELTAGPPTHPWSNFVREEFFVSATATLKLSGGAGRAKAAIVSCDGGTCLKDEECVGQRCDASERETVRGKGRERKK